MLRKRFSGMRSNDPVWVGSSSQSLTWFTRGLQKLRLSSPIFIGASVAL